MNALKAGMPLSRRRALKLGTGMAGSLMALSTFGSKFAMADSEGGAKSTVPSDSDKDTIQNILDATGQVSDGLFQVEIERKDITDVMLHGVPITPAFQINGTIYFQNLGGGKLIMNGDMAFKPEEIDPFIGALIENGITLQAEHQHMYDFEPIVWFMHYRAVGTAEMLARGLKAALDKTSTPFPQAPPSNPKTPLPAQQMGEIIGAKPQVGSDGVVTFNVPRKESILLGGVHVSPYLNIAAQIAFQPYGGGRNAAAIPDYALIASEVNNVVGYGRKHSWDIGCLYNQETDEHPQLYFSHQFKTGDALELSHEIRMALNMTNSMFE